MVRKIKSKSNKGNKSQQGMMKQAQEMQKQMLEVQEGLKEKEVESSVGGGAVKAVVNGQKELVSIKLSKEAVDPDDVEMLEDLIVSAVKEATRQAGELADSEMNKITGGLNIPGLT